MKIRIFPVIILLVLLLCGAAQAAEAPEYPISFCHEEEVSSFQLTFSVAEGAASPTVTFHLPPDALTDWNFVSDSRTLHIVAASADAIDLGEAVATIKGVAPSSLTMTKLLINGKQVSKLQAHNWNEGVITTKPTQGSDGLKTFTCSVCCGTKTEGVKYVDELGVPTITVTNNLTTGKPYIKWTAVEGATGYQVYYSTSSAGEYKLLYTAQAGKLYVNHSGKSAQLGNEYFYKVRAVKNGVHGQFSDAKSVWCDLPRPVVTLSNRASDGKPVISWTAVEGATAYEVYRCNTKNGEYKWLYTAKGAKLSVTHTGAAVGNDYFYKVRAVYGSNTKCNSALTAAKGVWVDLKRPTIKVLNSVSTGKPVISWNKVDYAANYKVYCAVGSSKAEYKLIYTTPGPDKLSVTHVGAKAGEAYFYKVVAVHKNSKCTSAESAYQGVYCDLARPNLTVTLNSKGKPYLSWTKVEGADGYKVYRSTDGVKWYLTYTAKANDFDVNHNNATAGTTYYYKVFAVCNATSKGNSAYSVVKKITMN